MRSLRLVGPGDDGASLIVEAIGTLGEPEQFSLPIDERLRNASSSDLPRMPMSEAAVAKAPAPREIQTRVRAGETAQAVADQAGISLERVMRFAYPVLAERVRVTDEARRARARRGGDGQLVEFGELIELRLSNHGLDAKAIDWDAYRREDGGWTVTASLPVEPEPVLAKFSFALMNRTVSALNDIAADLLSDRPVQALLPPAPEAYNPIPVPADLPTRVRLSAVPNHAADVESDSGPAATDETSTPAVRPSSGRQKAHTRSVPVGIEDELFDQDAPDTDQVLFDEPPLPLELDVPEAVVEEPAPDATQKRGRRSEKPRMPSWDDILLGVRNKTD